jgi:hypothetical protein
MRIEEYYLSVVISLPCRYIRIVAADFIHAVRSLRDVSRSHDTRNLLFLSVGAGVRSRS